jgi:hypothetical protein
MHQQAILTTSHPVLGNIGDPVTIVAVEQLFATSPAANNGIGYKCADANCGIRVRAVITKLSKQRKNSPSSYFAAKGTKHVQGCTRQPKPNASTNTHAVATAPASPNRSARPVIWVDPRQVPASGGASVGGGGNAANGNGGSGRGRNSHGSGTTSGRSKMIESYAIEWLSMTTHQKQSENLQAPWNPGGTYFSAFHPIWFYPNTDVNTVGEKIFVGTFKSVIKSKTGYVITLNEKNATGEELWIWVQDVAFSYGAAGASLKTRLVASAVSPSSFVGKRVFALENFTWNSGGKGPWSSIPVVHPHMMWIEQ